MVKNELDGLLDARLAFAGQHFGGTPLRSLAVSTLLISAGCPAHPLSGAASSAVVSGVVVSEQSVSDELRRMPPYLREQFLSPNGNAELQQALSARTALIAEARRQGLQDLPEVRRQVREYEDRLLVRELVARAQPAAPDEATLRAFYDNHLSDFTTAQAWELARVEAASAKSGAAAKQVLANIRDALDVRKAGLDSVGRLGGQVQQRWARWTAAEIRDPAVRSAVTALQPGDVTRVLEDLAAPYLLVATTVETPRTAAFEEVRQQVAARVIAERHQRAFRDVAARVGEGKGGDP